MTLKYVSITNPATMESNDDLVLLLATDSHIVSSRLSDVNSLEKIYQEAKILLESTDASVICHSWMDL